MILQQFYRRQNMFLWLMIAILVAVCSVAGFIYLTIRISAFGFIKKLSKDKKVLKYAISAGLIVLTGGIIWLIWEVPYICQC